jgi:SAM-dependent methyltransferase
MNRLQTSNQYATGLSRQRIERALTAAGRDVGHLEPSDLGVFEDFHTLGRIATRQLAELAGINDHDRVLDAGSGIGGTSRFLAGHYGCSVTALDLTAEYCATTSWLNRLVGLEDPIIVRQGDVTELPFADASFDLVISQHVQMNVPDKVRLYQEARRVLNTGGRLAIWDIVAGTPGRLEYPLPWGNRPELSFLVSADQLCAFIGAAGFDIVHWNDLTEEAAEIMAGFLSEPLGPLGLHSFVDHFAEKASNLTRGLSNGRLRAIEGVARATC